MNQLDVKHQAEPWVAQVNETLLLMKIGQGDLQQFLWNDDDKFLKNWLDDMRRDRKASDAKKAENPYQ